MKNIHILPTDKPSRIYTCGIALYINKVDLEHDTNQHIYITNNEEIKEGDWYYDTTVNEIFKNDKIFLNGFGYKKIILTTDDLLIKDGVQAIDDEFLEWFVKNPSCEFVKTLWTIPAYKIEKEYIIQIPKQKPKQVLGVNYEFSIDDEAMSIEIPIVKQETFEDKLKELVEKWQQQQVHYETLAEHYIDDQHNNRKFTYKAMATRDCWKELLKLIENGK